MNVVGIDRVGCDFDGTLMNYLGQGGELHRVNHALLDQLRGRFVWVLTNQGGLPFGLSQNHMQGTYKTTYPTPYTFFERLWMLYQVVPLYDITLLGISCCIYHPKADQKFMTLASDGLTVLALGFPLPVFVYNGADYRKPAPGMFWKLNLSAYYGDDETDKQAAEAAGVPFYPVERYMGT